MLLPLLHLCGSLHSYLSAVRTRCQAHTTRTCQFLVANKPVSHPADQIGMHALVGRLRPERLWGFEARRVLGTRGGSGVA